MSLYLIQDGERVMIDHLPQETLVALLRAGAEIEDNENQEKQETEREAYHGRN